MDVIIKTVCLNQSKKLDFIKMFNKKPNNNFFSNKESFLQKTWLWIWTN